MKKVKSETSNKNNIIIIVIVLVLLTITAQIKSVTDFVTGNIIRDNTIDFSLGTTITNKDKVRSVIYLQASAECVSCFKTITLDSSNLKAISEMPQGNAYSLERGLIDANISYYLDVKGEEIVITDKRDEGSQTTINKGVLNLSTDDKIISVRSYKEDLYIITISNDNNSDKILSLYKYDSELMAVVKIIEKNEIDIPEFFDSEPVYTLHTGFADSKYDYVYISATAFGKETRIYAVNLLAKTITLDETIGRCTASAGEGNCSGVTEKLAVLSTYSCGDSIISPMYGQDGDTTVSITNTKTGRSTTTSGTFVYCDDK